MASSSDHASQASEESISASNEQACESLGSASRTSSADPSSSDTGPESPASQTSAMFISENQRAEVLLTDYARQLTAGGGKPGQGYPAVLTGFHMTQDPISEPDGVPALSGNAYAGVSISYAEESPVRTGASPDAEQDLPAQDPDSSSSSQGSQPSLFDLEGGSSLRTSPACSLPALALDAASCGEWADQFLTAIAEPTSTWSSPRWPGSAFTISPTELWTQDTSECPSGGGVSSSLADVLLDRVPERFFLSQKAAVGILRRAEARSRGLPPALEKALRRLAQMTEES